MPLHNIFCSRVYHLIYASMQTFFLTSPTKKNDLEFCGQILLQKKNYGLPFLKQTATLIMLMNHNTTQHSRIQRLAQTSMFTPQFLKADDTSVTSGLENHVSKLLKLGTAYPRRCPAFYQGAQQITK